MQELEFFTEGTPPDLLEETAVRISYFMYAFMGFCGGLAIAGRFYARKVGADNVRVMGVVYFGIYTWDFFSDVVFDARLAQREAWILFACSTLFVLIPYILNMIQEKEIMRAILINMLVR